MGSRLEVLQRAWEAYSAQLQERDRILVVEDDVGVFKMFGALLSRHGFECAHAESAAVALEAVAPEAYEAVIVDRGLPDLDGVELIRRIHAIDPTCETILMVGYAGLNAVLSALDLGVADYLTKPLPTVGILPAAVKRVIRRRNRRLLTVRMIEDLRHVVLSCNEREAWPHLSAARRRLDSSRSQQARQRVVMFADKATVQTRPVAISLAEYGYSVPLVRFGEEVLQRCGTGEADVLVVGDALEDMTGLELYERLVELPERPEVLFASGRPGLHDLITAVERGAFGYAVKPIEVHEVFARTVERACLERQERLHNDRVVSELRGVVDALADCDANDEPSPRLDSALSGFAAASAQVALRNHQLEVGESAWGTEPGGGR